MGEEKKPRRGSVFGSRGDNGGLVCEARMGELESGDECAGLWDVAVVKSKLNIGRWGDGGDMVLIILSDPKMAQMLLRKRPTNDYVLKMRS